MVMAAMHVHLAGAFGDLQPGNVSTDGTKSCHCMRDHLTSYKDDAQVTKLSNV